jgi:hypothetical protein
MRNQTYCIIGYNIHQPTCTGSWRQNTDVIWDGQNSLSSMRRTVILHNSKESTDCQYSFRFVAVEDISRSAFSDVLWLRALVSSLLRHNITPLIIYEYQGLSISYRIPTTFVDSTAFLILNPVKEFIASKKLNCLPSAPETIFYRFISASHYHKIDCIIVLPSKLIS